MVAGENWKREVQTSKTGMDEPERQKLYDTRLNFYKDRVKNKLGETFDNIVNDALLRGYKTLEQHEGKTLDHEVKAGDTLFVILKDFYKSQFGLDQATAEKEAYLSLAYLMSRKQDMKANVDELEVGWKVGIKNGMIGITDASGNTLKYAELRPLSAGTPAEGPDAYHGPTGEELARQAAIRAAEAPAGAGQAIVEAEPAITVPLETEPAHITALKERLSAFEDQYELNKEGNLISLKTGPYLPLSVQWNDSIKEWIIPRADLQYEKPEEALADLTLIHKAEKIWTHNMSNAAPGEDPFYLESFYTGDPDKNIKGDLSSSLRYQSDWLDERLEFPAFGDKEKLLAHINRLYKENAVAKEAQTSEPRPEESGKGMLARKSIQDALKSIPLDLVYTIHNSTELSVKAKISNEAIKMNWNEATKAWEFTHKDLRYSDSDLVYMAKQAYKLQIEELK